MLTPIECIGSQFINGKNVGHLWRCRCDCGNEKITNSNYLRFGRVKSCGCMISAGEAETEALLNQKKVKHTRQYLFPDLVSDSGNYLMFDFAIKDDDDSLICLIEYQGVQHYDPDMDFGKQQRPPFLGSLLFYHIRKVGAAWQGKAARATTINILKLRCAA